MKCNLYIIWILLQCLCCFIFPNPGQTESVKNVLKKARCGGTFKQPEKNELALAKSLFAGMLNGVDLVDSVDAVDRGGRTDHRNFLDLKSAWQKLDYDFKKIQEKQTVFYALSETDSRKSGRGFFLFPARSGRDILLEIPHSFKDLYTGDIGLKLFLEGQFAAAAWNTVPRYFTENKVKIDADMSDLMETWFAAFTKAFASKYPKGHVIQLHGFARGKRKSLSGKVSDMIISTGIHHPPPWLNSMDQCLESKFSAVINTFPLETKELGATQTSIGMVMRNMGHQGFLHIEISKAMRKALRDNAASREKLLGCFKDVLK